MRWGDQLQFTAEAGPGAAVLCRWTRQDGERRATLVCAAGTAEVTLRSAGAAAETPAHRVTAEGATVAIVVVPPPETPDAAAAQGSVVTERFRVGAGGGPATIAEQLPHQGPRISATVQPGDVLEYLPATTPGTFPRYRAPAANRAAVVFAVGTKVLRAPPGTEMSFRPDGMVEVAWSEAPETQFRFVFPIAVLEQAGGLAYRGVPDLILPQPVSRSKP